MRPILTRQARKPSSFLRSVKTDRFLNQRQLTRMVEAVRKLAGYAQQHTDLATTHLTGLTATEAEIVQGMLRCYEAGDLDLPAVVASLQSALQERTNLAACSTQLDRSVGRSD